MKLYYFENVAPSTDSNHHQKFVKSSFYQIFKVDFEKIELKFQEKSCSARPENEFEKLHQMENF